MFKAVVLNFIEATDDEQMSRKEVVNQLCRDNEAYPMVLSSNSSNGTALKIMFAGAVSQEQADGVTNALHEAFEMDGIEWS